MTDLLRLIVDVIQYIWPFVIVHQWQRGVWYVCGRYWRTVGPGVYPRIPFFMDIHDVTLVPDSHMTNPYTITTKGAAGDTLTFAFVYELEVLDANLANNTVQDYEGKAHMDVLAIVADTLADLPEARLQPDVRNGMIRKCLLEVNKELGRYGMRCNSLRFTIFVRNMKNYRLFNSIA
jgi:SPFH domain/Band 7 family protein